MEIQSSLSLTGAATSSPLNTSSKISPSEGRSSVESSPSTLVCSDSLEAKNGISWFCYPHGSRTSATKAYDDGLSHIPLLRVASKSLRLELTAVTNWPAKPTEQLDQTHEPCTPPLDSDQLRSSLIDPAIAVPTFTIPTSHTHRKAKMDRIRKRLGSEVPYQVVFPEDVKQMPEDFSERAMPPRNLHPLPDVTPLTPRSHKHLERRRPPLVGNIAIEKLSLIPECPEEGSGGRRISMVDFSRMKGRTTKRRDTADSRLLTCGDGQGVAAFGKRPASYRKPPPPLLEVDLGSF